MKYFKILASIALLIILMPTLTTSCIKEEEWLCEDARLDFSCDTVAFDTVFVTMGTTTKQLKVYNNNEQPVRISSVTLQGGKLSRFRLNVDGDTSLVVRNVEIAAHDSIFIFVQANINPNSSAEPFLVKDAILFNFEESQKQIPLTAYGRNAVYHVAKPGNWTSIIDCDNWDHSLPHVILGYAAVDSLCTLNLMAGDKIYFGNDAVLLVYNGATLKVQGSHDNPVLFTSLRHDGWYDTLPGQWGYIWLYQGSRNNEIDWAVIENGTIGLVVDTLANSNPTLSIRNSRILNQSRAGLLGQGSYIEGDNLLITNCGQATLALQYGGRYRFRNSTFADYWPYSGNRRKNPSVILNNLYVNGETGNAYPRPLEQAYFDNCIICGNYGSSNGENGEVLLDIDPSTGHNIKFRNCMVKSSQIDEYCQDCIPFANPQFDTASNLRYHPSANSPFVGQGNSSYITLPNDLDNTPRSMPPTIGAFELKGNKR